MTTESRVLIVGSGFAGLGTAIRLKQAGITDFVILERASHVGGTWRDNRYPGAACDVPAPLYSFSFEPNPNWSTLFAGQREILGYLEHCADKYGLRTHIRFESEVKAAHFDEQRGAWTVTTQGGQQFCAQALVTGTGLFSRPAYPAIAGLEHFSGSLLHTADWRDDCSLEGKRIALIGTGASAVQVLPSIVDRAAHVCVFQRTPHWVLPRPEHDFGDLERRLFATLPWLQQLLRGLIYAQLEIQMVGFSNLLPTWQTVRQRKAIKYLSRAVKDSALRRELTPDYRIGCKRILVSTDYYAALQRHNAELVTVPIREMTAGGIVTSDGRERAFDAVVCATGFQTAEHFAPFPIHGRGGVELEALWRDGAESYLGTTVSGFPNLFMLTGPNTALGHNSMVYIIESQIRYIIDALQTMHRRGLRWVDVRADTQGAYNARVQQQLEPTVWATGGCSSWYRTKTDKNTTIWPDFSFVFRHKTRRFDLEEYELAAAQEVRPPTFTHDVSGQTALRADATAPT
jgi:cation diffusion facilitator CzcD-associated flavoprotein CzcO